MTHPIRNRFITTLALLSAFAVPALRAQEKPAIATDKTPATTTAPAHPRHVCSDEPTQLKTFYLANSIQGGQDANEILVALRNMLDPCVKIFLVSEQNAIVIEAPAEQLRLADQLLKDLDRPKRTYRLTYTITEVDDGKPIGTQHYSMIVVSGQRTTLKQGSKIPVATGSYSNGAASSNSAAGIQTQFTYLDIGMSFDATLDDFANGVRLRTKVEESSQGPPSTIAGVVEPVVRQTVLEGTGFLTIGKPLTLGSVDIPDSTRHIDVAVVMDQVK